MIELLSTAFIEPLGQAFFIKSLIGASIAAIVCSVIGCLVILRKMSFLGDALSHAMIAGVSGGYLFMKLIFDVEAHAPAMLIGSVIAAVITVALIGFVSNISRIKEDTVIGIIYTGIFAAGVVLVSVFHEYIHIDIVHFIMGDVLGIADSDLWIAVIVASIVLSMIILFFRYFQITSFDPVMAASIGIPVVLINYLLTTGVSLVVVSAVSMVGVILVVGLLITPAATAYLLSDRLQHMMLLAAFFGVTSVVGGLYISIWIDSSGGGAIMLFCTFQFMVVLAVAPRYGMISKWLRRKRMIPQELLEDVLVVILRESGAPVTGKTVTRYVRAYKNHIPRALKRLEQEGQIGVKGQGYILTLEGEKEAIKILRAHRIWETYLEHIGAPGDQLHSIAHQLEHLNDNDAVGYLDGMLGHPEEGPHGEEIPVDPNLADERGKVQLSLLRRGAEAVVEDPGKSGKEKGLRKKDRLEVAPREDNGETWVVIHAGKKIHLKHEEADDIIVRITG